MEHKQLQSVMDIFENANKVKGRDFVNFIKFVGLTQGFCTTMLSKCLSLGATQEEMDQLAVDAANLSSMLCTAYANAIDVSEQDMEEALRLVEKIDEHIDEEIKRSLS
jgi:hypothetical protein